MENILKVIISIFKILYKLVYLLIVITLPVFVLYYWNFQYVDKIIDFLKISWWPLVLLFIILLFKEEVGSFINDISELDIFGNKAKRNKQIPNQDSQPSKELDVSKEYKEINEQYKTLINSLGNNVDTLKNQLANKEIELDFERIFNVIFGSQIFILKYLLTANFVGLNDIAKYYGTVQRNNPTLQSWGINQYLFFLISSKLIEPAISGGFQITPKGKLFIMYIEEIRKYNLNKIL
jgi:hypothetical protein